MVALCSFLADPDDQAAETARQLAAAEADVQRFRGVLARPSVTGSWADKIGWQLEAAARAVARLRRQA